MGLKFYLLDQTKMNNEETIRQILLFLKDNTSHIEEICGILEKIIQATQDVEQRVTALELKAINNEESNKNWMSKLTKLSEELEWIF